MLRCLAWRPFKVLSKKLWSKTMTWTWRTMRWPIKNFASNYYCHSAPIDNVQNIVNDTFKRHYSYSCLFCFPCRFCSQLGGLFGFVVSDLEDKIGLLQQLVTEDKQHFSTVQTMIIHEISKELVFSGRSGSITLLRLHRGLGKTSSWRSINT